MVKDFERLEDCPAQNQVVVLGGVTVDAPASGLVTIFRWCSHARRCEQEWGSVLDIPGCRLHEVLSSHPPVPSRSAADSRKSTTYPVPVKVSPELADLLPSYIENRRRDAKELAALLACEDLGAIDKIAQRMVGGGAMFGFDEITALGRAIRKAVAGPNMPDLKDAISAYDDYLARVRFVEVESHRPEPGMLLSKEAPMSVESFQGDTATEAANRSRFFPKPASPLRPMPRPRSVKATPA